MEKLPLKKQIGVVRLYFNGLSYREIAAKVRVSTGAVASVISNLKAGSFPEAGDISEDVDGLRELSVDLQRFKLAPVQALAGITVINHLKELGLEPGEISTFASACRFLTAEGVDVKVFSKAAMALKEAQERTGLSADELEKKVKSLEESVRRLEPLNKKVMQTQEQLRELVAKKQALLDEMATMEKRLNALRENVRSNEQREAKLLDNIAQLEDRLHSTDLLLAGARKELKELSGLGISFDDLSGFAERLKGITHRHGISLSTLNKRLLEELERLDQGLTLKALVDSRKQELQGVKKAVAKAKEELGTLTGQKQQSRRELTALRAQIAEEKTRIAEQIRSINTAAENAIAQFKGQLARGIQEGIEGINRLKTDAIELGREFGKFQAAVEANEWVNDLLSLAKGDDGISANKVRVIGLMLLRAISAWLDRNPGSSTYMNLLKRSVAGTMSELEKWTIPVGSNKA